MIARYVFDARVISVYQEQITYARNTGEVDPETGRDKWEKVTTTTGRWFVRISESSAICVGNEKPDIKEGDMVTMTMQKKVTL